VALRAEEQGRDLETAEEEAFEVRPVELPSEYLSAIGREAPAPAASAAPASGPAPHKAEDRPLYPLTSAQTLIIPAGFGLFAVVLALLFLVG